VLLLLIVRGERLAVHDPLPPGAPDAAVLRFDLAPDADLRLLDSSMPATVASAGCSITSQSP
jgi:hypothetical protein